MDDFDVLAGESPCLRAAFDGRLAALVAAPAAAQSAPQHRNLDGNGVDLIWGDHVASFPEGSIGSGEAALALVRVRGSRAEGSQWDMLTFHRDASSSSSATVTIRHGATSETFTGTLFSLTASQANGGSLSYDGGDYVYTAGDGTQTVFSDRSGYYSGGASIIASMATRSRRAATCCRCR